MKARTKKLGTRAVAMLLSAVTAFSLFPVSAGAAQVNSYHDPAENWMQASGRTNELDVNAVVTHETFNCGVCGKATSFQAFRTPEYTRDGQTAMNRNVKYSDGTMVGGSGTGTILDGVPGQNASYTGYHWTKAVCETCGTVNSNMSINDYGFGKNVYWLYDCDSKFMQELPEQKTYGENNPIVVKSQFIMSLVERIDPNGVGPQQKSIIDRCVAAVYQEAEQSGTVPTLSTLREMLLDQPEEKAKDIALALELFTTGSLDIFGHKSTVNLDKRVVVFDIHGLGEQLKPIGHLVITDTMLNRVTLNWKRGKRTHVFIDEFHVMFENEFSAAFFNSAWRQFRKRNAYPTAITQNVEYLLDSVQASTMLSNSEFIVMLNQAASDREKLAHLLNISNEQMSYITNADAGCGLIKYGSALVPFINRFPQNTKLYELMTTRPGEGQFAHGQE